MCVVPDKIVLFLPPCRLQNLEDHGAFQSLGICQGFDLRSDVECETRGYVTFEEQSDFHVTRTPVFKSEDYSPQALAERWGCYAKGPEGFCDAYLQIMESGGSAFKAIFEFLAQTKKPVVVFCTAVALLPFLLPISPGPR